MTGSGQRWSSICFLPVDRHTVPTRAIQRRVVGTITCRRQEKTARAMAIKASSVLMQLCHIV